MAETAKYALEDQMGCGFMSTILHLTGFRPRNGALFRESPYPRRQLKNPKSTNKPQCKRSVQHKPILARPMPSKPSDHNVRNPTVSGSQLVNSSYIRRLAEAPTFTSSELSLRLSADRRNSDANNRTLYRASTGNVMLLGHLGNLKQKGNQKSTNLVKKKVEKAGYQLGNVFQHSTNRLSPAEGIKLIGNDKYRQGKYEEALALYDRAIAIDPCNACYYSNKSAALIGLGRLLEAAVQCQEAVRLDSSYYNAHCRLATLYLRLGAAEKAVYHYKCSGHKARHEDIARAQSVKNCFDRCVEAQDRGDWAKVMTESRSASVLGADSAPQVYTMKAKALLNLKRHEEAYTVVQEAPCLRIKVYAQLFDSSAAASVLQVRALVYMANGRFEDAVSDVQQALQLDSGESVRLTAERIRGVASARVIGNRLFKGSRFSEALTAYNKGLEKDPYNSVLLCNRGACRSKLGQYEKAVEDCTAALAVRPSYSKARLRRADCNAKLERWEAAIEDYEAVAQEMPGDEKAEAALLEAKVRINTRHNGCNMEMHPQP